MSKFLVLWSLEPATIGPAAMKAVLSMPAYAAKLIAAGKLEKRYHIVGRHGGAWIFNVDTNEELDRFLAMAPVYNFSSYEVLALAEMTEPNLLNEASGSSTIHPPTQPSE